MKGHSRADLRYPLPVLQRPLVPRSVNEDAVLTRAQDRNGISHGSRPRPDKDFVKPQYPAHQSNRNASRTLFRPSGTGGNASTHQPSRTKIARFSTERHGSTTTMPQAPPKGRSGDPSPPMVSDSGVPQEIELPLHTIRKILTTDYRAVAEAHKYWTGVSCHLRIDSCISGPTSPDSFPKTSYRFSCPIFPRPFKDKIRARESKNASVAERARGRSLVNEYQRNDDPSHRLKTAMEKLLGYGLVAPKPKHPLEPGTTVSCF